MRKPTLLAIAILLSACGYGEAEEVGSPIVVTTTTTTTMQPSTTAPPATTVAPAAAAEPAPTTAAPEVAVEGTSDEAPAGLAQTDVPETATTSSTTTTTTTTSTTTTTTTSTTVAPAVPDETDVFCTTMSDVARSNPHQASIETDAAAYASFIEWEIAQLERASAPATIADDFAAYIEAERRTLAWVRANSADVADVRALGSNLAATLEIVDLSAGVNRYLGFLRTECPGF